MSDYDSHHGIGFGSGVRLGPDYDRGETKCKFCKGAITFKNRVAMNRDGSNHRCFKSTAARDEDFRRESDARAKESHQAMTSCASTAMQAIVIGLVSKGGKDAVHAMDSRMLADAAWGIAVAMRAAADSYKPSEGDGE